MVSALLGFMAVSGLSGQQNLQHLTVKLRAADELFAHLPGRVTVTLQNHRHWLPAFLIAVEIADGERLFPLVAAADKRQLDLTLTFTDRGYQSVPDIWIHSCFPINFFVRSRKLKINAELLVFPCPQAVILTSTEAEGLNARQQELTQPGQDGELRNIDIYQAGDPLKSIHWKLSARHDDYRVKRLNQLGAPALTLNPDNFSGSLEQRLGQCTFLINQMNRTQQAVGLKLGDKQIAPAPGRHHGLRLLTELALYAQR